VPRATQDPASSPVSFRLQGCHLLRPAFPCRSPSRWIGNSTLAVLQPRNRSPFPGLGSFAFARRYWRNHSCFLLLQVLRWFTSLGSLSPPYVFRRESSAFRRIGFPHSDTPGSMPVCGSPGLFAACHVLRRLSVPRHPLYALRSLTIHLFTVTRDESPVLSSKRRLLPTPLLPSSPAALHSPLLLAIWRT
jgi:hypothetical protein